MEKLRVLIINDRTQPAAEQFPIEQTLVASGLAVEPFKATDWAAASRVMENHGADCILLNTASLEAVSVEFLQALKTMGKSLPIFVVADDAEPQTIERWRKEGVKEVLRRDSLTPELLVHTLWCETRLYCVERQASFEAECLQQNDQLVLRQYQIIEAQRQQIQQLNDQLLQASQLKTQFLATVSHELRTPMNAVIGFSQLLQRGPDPLSPRQANMVQRILANAKQLLSSIEEILTFSRIEAGQLSLQPESVNLVHLIGAVVAELQDTADQKRLSVNVRFDLANPQIATDPTYLQQILFNLISNAVKFTATGSITVTTEAAGADWIAITIWDTGIGIPPADLKHIFEPFRQVDQTITRSHRGIGLGLALTAALVKQLQGQITIKSDINQGTEVRVELPRQMAVPPSQRYKSQGSQNAVRIASRQLNNHLSR